MNSNLNVKDYCVNITIDFLISYINNKIVAFYIQELSKLLSCNTLYLDDIFNKDLFKPIYFENSDIFIVSFVYSTLLTRFLKTEMKDIKVGTNNVDNIICLSFYSASNRIAKELSLKEKANHKKKLKEKLLNWYKLIIYLQHILFF